MTISNRELTRIKREMSDLTYYSIPTDILRELIEYYRQNHSQEQEPTGLYETFRGHNKRTDD